MALVKQTSEFTQVPNKLLNNRDITLKAKGLWAFVNSKPNGWNFSIKGIQTQCREGRESIASALKELEKYGYLKRVLSQNQNDGLFSGYDYHLFDLPLSEYPLNGKTVNGEAVALSKTEVSKTEKVSSLQSSKIDFDGFLNFINKTTGREFRTINKTVRGKFNARIKDGYKKEDIVNAIINASKIQSHRENGCQYLTPEFFSRASTLDKYGFSTSSTKKDSVDVTDKMESGEFVNF